MNDKVNDDDVEFEEPQKTVEEELSSIQEMFEGGESLELRIHRIPTSGDLRKRPYLFKMSPSEMDQLEGELQNKYGTGSYEIRVWDCVERGIARRFSIDVEALPKEDKPEPVLQQPQAQQDDLKGLIGEMFAGMRDMQIQSESRNKDLMIELMMKMQPQQTTQPPISIKEIVEIGATLKGMFGGNKENNTAKELKEMLAIVTQVKEFAEPEPDSPWPIVRDTLGSLADMAKSQLKTPGNAKPGSQQQTPENEQMLVMKVLQQQLQGLIKQAEKGSDPGLYADLIIDNLPEQYVPNLRALLGQTNEEALQNVLKIITIQPIHYNWFFDLFNFLRDELTEEMPPESSDLTEPSVDDISIVNNQQDSSDSTATIHSDVTSNSAGQGGDEGDVTSNGENDKEGQNAISN